MTSPTPLRLALLVVALVVAPTQLRGQIRISSVAVAPGFVRGLPAPGSLASIFCTGLTGIDGVLQAQPQQAPLELAGVRVEVGSVAAPILAVANFPGYQQINFQVPWEALSSLVAVTLGAARDVFYAGSPPHVTPAGRRSESPRR